MKPIKDIAPRELKPGITGYYAHGDAMTMGYVELMEGSSIPMHQHVQEQITYILEGQLDMIIDGNECILNSGYYHVIPANIPHSAIARTFCKVIDAFSPVREDYQS